MFARQWGTAAALLSCGCIVMTWKRQAQDWPISFANGYASATRRSCGWRSRRVFRTASSARSSRAVPCPGPGTLRKLAKPLGIPLGQLLVIAGYISEEEYEAPIQQTDLARLYEISDLTDEEWKQVLEFVRYVRSRRKG